VQAWLGDEIALSGGMNIEDQATRARIVTAARQVMGRGFDGVHLDLEPVGDADPGYLELLSALGPVVHAAGGILSVSAEQVEPVSGTRWAMEAVEGHSSWWSAGYLHQVASRVDQVAIMSYDTALWSPSAYAGFVRDETTVTLAAVPSNVAVLIGVPAYHDAHSLAHVSSAETVAAALRGVRLALKDGTSTNRRFGVALYIDFAATSADWSAYRSDWA
jgi:spore germination protein YaaH